MSRVNRFSVRRSIRRTPLHHTSTTMGRAGDLYALGMFGRRLSQLASIEDVAQRASNTPLRLTSC